MRNLPVNSVCNGRPEVIAHNSFMELALTESKKALPDCLPNPPVGCVLVKDGHVVAMDHTKAPGDRHAEVDAFSKYPGPTSDLTVYVTLEPCFFYGRTPACADAIVKKRVRRVVVALTDPDPRNNGKGLMKLRRAGIEVVDGIFSGEVGRFLAPYLGNR